MQPRHARDENDFAQYQTEWLKLQPGEAILLFTDGLTEASDTGDNEFSEQWLETALGKIGAGPLEEVVHGIITDVKSFSTGAPQSDDITLLAVRHLG